ncbi:MAG: NAD(P)/FAD-dependent oxidoreductase [Gammaproteobacteria bacterium]
MNEPRSAADAHCIIVGASHAGVQSALRLRRLGFEGRITMLGDEPHAPYHRPPLSKDYLTGEKPQERIALVPEAGYAKNGIDLRRDERATGVHCETRMLKLQDDRYLNYDHLILALGARVRRLNIQGSDLPGIHYLRNIGHVNAIRDQVVAGGKAVVVGGGYIGLETAASLRKLGMDVTIVESLERVLQRVTGKVVSNFYRRLHESQGVKIIESDQVTHFEGTKSVRAVQLASETRLPADLVIVGIGVIPNTEIAATAGLAVDNGICVDQFARTADEHVYAVGDCASFVHPLYDRRVRIESVQNAGEQALAAARSIVGAPEPYTAVPWFWSDQFDVKLQIAGLSHGADEVLVRGDAHEGAGFSVLHIKDGRLLAIDAINATKDFVHGRKLIAEGVELDPARAIDATLPLAP